MFEASPIMNPSFLYALIGGLFIGIAATLLLAGLGRVMGISGIVGRLPFVQDRSWRIALLAGMLSAGILYKLLVGDPFVVTESRWPLLVAAGLLVGFGTRLGNGCTSGHGVCGISRLSVRSILATLVFIATGMITVGLMR
jgi:uncharacterized membrane protein YedE/YeeE